ncbi:hypothetical protein BKN14_01180 [Candidatus Gracilibacteria bacterium HOT-871]|nr:hypothetical protein BKN14_01180 [Candidatus Gracilibacteria bacterium HOT-871]MBB1564477.1 nucleoside monophosphate kinase [Candidatus Gracilibacteria bacterium]RKW22680.1 MAG: nucleoside monophosphate kinase [Candidatus Gracilibacteria bacterium]
MKLAFVGIQGCGKGTQGRILAEKYGFKVLELGTEFRNIIKSGSELGEKIKELVNNGMQVTEDLGREVMEKILTENTDENIIYDGFIRNKWNLEVFNNFVEDYKVVLFEIDLNKAKNRLYSRMYDLETGETFPGDMQVNPKNGNKLVKRDDDKDLEAIKKRFSEYIEKTLPVVEAQQKQGIVYEINADQEIEKVTEELERKLGLK